MVKTIYCETTILEVNNESYILNVKEITKLKDPPRTIERYYKVEFWNETQNLNCVCRSFQYRGILCCQALSVLKNRNINQIPPQYIKDRWRKDQIKLHVRETWLHYAAGSNTLSKYEDIMQKCIEFAKIEAISQVKHIEVVQNQISDDCWKRIKR